MAYTKREFADIVTELGEVFIVLESDREYIVHGESGYEFEEWGDATFVKLEGLQEGEYLEVSFPLDAIEHHYTHREV